MKKILIDVNESCPYGHIISSALYSVPNPFTPLIPLILVSAEERPYLIGYHSSDDEDEHFYVHTKKESTIEKESALVSDFSRAWFGASIEQEMANFKNALLSKAGTKPS